MIGRRRLLGAGVAAGVLGGLGAAPSEAAAQREVDEELQRLSRAVEEVRDALDQQRQFTELAAVRSAQQAFMRSNGKLPDFIEVGMDVWFGVHDWHVRWQQPIVIGRDPGARYTLRLMETILILRPETPGGYVGIPFDER